MKKKINFKLNLIYISSKNLAPNYVINILQILNKYKRFKDNSIFLFYLFYFILFVFICFKIKYSLLELYFILDEYRLIFFFFW